MIYVTVEIWPNGRESEKRQLGRMVIANQGSGTMLRGDYAFVIEGKQRILKGGVGSVKNFPRKSKNVWHLLHKVLEEYMA